MSEPGIRGTDEVPPESTPRATRARGSRLLRALAATWFLLAGYVLLLAPMTSFVWNESFWAEVPRLQSLLHRSAVRHGLSAFGCLLLLAGVAELVVLLLSGGGHEPDAT